VRVLPTGSLTSSYGKEADRKWPNTWTGYLLW
jgi:hypothetical protein